MGQMSPQAKSLIIERQVTNAVYKILSERFAGTHYSVVDISKEVAKVAIEETKRQLSSWKL